jgi:hypothetical protein
MRLKTRINIAAVISPLLLIGVLVNPAQAVTVGDMSCVSQSGQNIGHLHLSNILRPVVSYQITGLRGTGALVRVADNGPSLGRRYETHSAVQDGIYHAIQGPYNRTRNFIGVDFIFSNGTSCGVGKTL